MVAALITDSQAMVSVSEAAAPASHLKVDFWRAALWHAAGLIA